MKPISVLSKVTVWAPLGSKKVGVSFNPSGDLLYGACLPFPNQPPANPLVPPWSSAVWEATADPNVWSMGLEVGPGSSSGVILSAGVTFGLWFCWVDNPDQPITLSGTFKAF